MRFRSAADTPQFLPIQGDRQHVWLFEEVDFPGDGCGRGLLYGTLLAVGLPCWATAYGACLLVGKKGLNLLGEGGVGGGGGSVGGGFAVVAFEGEGVGDVGGGVVDGQEEVVAEAAEVAAGGVLEGFEGGLEGIEGVDHAGLLVGLGDGEIFGVGGGGEGDVGGSRWAERRGWQGSACSRA